MSKPKRPANLPHGRWLGDLEAERPLSDFEWALVKACALGEVCEPEDCNGERPDQGTTANTIRAELIRFLALGGDNEHPVHEAGVMLGGAWIVDELNLHQAAALVSLNVRRSHFTKGPLFIAATLPELGLSGSAVPYLNADRMVVKGGVFLDDGFTASGEVRLLGVQIGGVLQCRGSSFSNTRANALNAEGMVVKGGVFLDRGFSSNGEIRLQGVQIGGSLQCSGGAFSNAGANALNADGLVLKGSALLNNRFSACGSVRLMGAVIDGNLECDGAFSNAGARALQADRLVVKGGLFFRDASIDGVIGLGAAKVGTLRDSNQCWRSGDHYLDGFCYDRIIGPTDAKMRIAWLKGQRSGQLAEDFAPQPWEQLIKVLREMGHPAEAAEVAIAKQKALRRANKIGVRHANPDFTGWRLKIDELWIAAANRITRLWHRIYGALAGYGHRPADILAWMLALCMLNAVAYYGGRQCGLFGPTNAIIQTHPDVAVCGKGGTPGRVYWTSPDCPMPPEYTTFQPFLYSLDLILPLVDLGQDSDWAPIVANEKGETFWAGRALRWLMWFEILFGWMASLMLVAIVGRLVEKD